jgi:malate dehydrogenase
MITIHAVSLVAILGAGPIGAAIAHRLAERARVAGVRLIDERADVAAGKALDIRQSGPVGSFDTAVAGSGDTLAAVGASVVVIADTVAAGEWQGDRGLSLIGQLVKAGSKGPFVFAGASQAGLMETAARELRVPGDRIVGTAASAVATSVAALASVEAQQTGVDVAVAGRPPALVIGWSCATVAGSLLSERVPAHRLLTISQALPRLWPPGPEAIAAPTALIVEALIAGSRRPHHAMTILDGELGVRGVAAMLPLELGNGRVLARGIPSFSAKERTDLLSNVGRARA